jgi:hypothetical protein
MTVEMTKGRFGFHLAGGKNEPHAASPFVQIYVKSSALSRCADLAISPHLMNESEIDHFISEAISALGELKVEAMKALAAADQN